MLIFYHNTNPLSFSHYKERDLSFSLLHKNFPTLYKLSTLSHFIMSPQVILCLSNTQVLVYYLITIQSIYYLSWLFIYISIFTILLYTLLNFYQLMLPLTSIFGLKIPFSLFLLFKAKGQSFFSQTFVGHMTYTSHIYDFLIYIIILVL